MPRRRQQRKPRTNLAVSYIRTSSKAQDKDNSQERQLHHGTQTAEQLNLQMVHVFDDLASGLKSDTRPGFMAMLDFVRDPQNNISHVIIDDLSRLSRDPVFPIQLLADLRREGIAVHSYREGLINSRKMDMMVRVQSWQNNENSRLTSDLTKGGLRAAVRRGYNPASVAAYGYKREAVKDGEETHYKWVPHPEAAEVVKRIFDMYDQGYSVMDIVTELNRSNIPAPKGGLWTTSSARRILKNKAYAGYIIIGKNPSSTFDDGDEYLEDEDWEDDTYMEVAGGHEALVEEDLYNRVQKRMAGNTRTTLNKNGEPGVSSPRSPGSTNPLSERIKCGLCESNMVVSSRGKLMCSRKKNSGVSTCNKTDVLLFEILELITEELRERVITEDVIREQIAILKKDAPGQVKQETERKQKFHNSLAINRTKSHNLMQLAKESGTADPRLVDRFMKELPELWDEEEQLKSQLADITEETEETIVFLSNPSEIIETATEMETYLYSRDTTAVREFLRFFIRRVVLFDGKGKIEYSLPLPDTKTIDGKHESALSFSDEEILLEHAGPAHAGIDPCHFPSLLPVGRFPRPRGDRPNAGRRRHHPGRIPGRRSRWPREARDHAATC